MKYRWELPFPAKVCWGVFQLVWARTILKDNQWISYWRNAPDAWQVALDQAIEEWQVPEVIHSIPGLQPIPRKIESCLHMPIYALGLSPEVERQFLWDFFLHLQEEEGGDASYASDYSPQWQAMTQSFLPLVQGKMVHPGKWECFQNHLTSIWEGNYEHLLVDVLTSEVAALISFNQSKMDVLHKEWIKQLRRFAYWFLSWYYRRHPEAYLPLRHEDLRCTESHEGDGLIVQITQKARTDQHSMRAMYHTHAACLKQWYQSMHWLPGTETEEQEKYNQIGWLSQLSLQSHISEKELWEVWYRVHWKGNDAGADWMRRFSSWLHSWKNPASMSQRVRMPWEATPAPCLWKR
jgi:hypothetical protein